MKRFLEVFVVGNLVSRSITCPPPYNRDKRVCITASHARSGVSKRAICTRVLVYEDVE